MSLPVLILASASPRRKDLLAPHFRLRVQSPDIDETPFKAESPRAYVRRMAASKWEQIASDGPKHPVLAADTIVVWNGKILGKPRNRTDALQMLKAMSNDEHEVITAVCMGKKLKSLFLVSTRVRFRALSKSELMAYLRSGEWKGKAGAYAIQGLAAHFVSEIRGSLTNVIGLPLERVISHLHSPGQVL